MRLTKRGKIVLALAWVGWMALCVVAFMTLPCVGASPC